MLDKMLLEMAKQIDEQNKYSGRTRRYAIQYIVSLVLDLRPADEYEKLIAFMDEEVYDMDLKETAEAIIRITRKDAEKQGRVQGEIQAKQEDIIKLLQIRFDNVPEAVIKKINAIQSRSRLNLIFEKAATAETFNNFHR